MPELTRVSDSIFTVHGLLSPQECDEYIALAESTGFADAPVTTAGGPVLMPDVRNNERVMLDDPARAADLWRRLRPWVDTIHYSGFRPVGVNERLRFYRYDPGQAFRWHRDGFYQSPDGRRSRLTYMVYLNDDFEGGETKFRATSLNQIEDLVVKPAKGMALVFSHPLLHEGAAVTRGRKYVVRTDVMYESDGPYVD